MVVTVLQLNRMELKDMIVNEIAENPVLEESGEGGEELTQAEIQALLETERTSEPADRDILERSESTEVCFRPTTTRSTRLRPSPVTTSPEPTAPPRRRRPPPPWNQSKPRPIRSIKSTSVASLTTTWIPGFKSPVSELVDKPSFETFLSAPITLSDHLESQLSLIVLPERVRAAADAIVGNMEESGYLTTPLEEIASAEGLTLCELQQGLKAVQSLDPTGVGAMTLRENGRLQLGARRGTRVSLG